MMKIKLWLTGLHFLLLTTTVYSQSNDRFQQANDAFQKNDFEKAAQLYEQLAEAGYRSTELEYNLGNAWYRLNSPGKAILHYERALVLAPNDEDVQHNLALPRQQLKDEIEALPDFFLARWWKNLRMVLSSTGWGVMALLLWWGGLAGLAVWQIGQTRKSKKLGFLAGLACLLLSLLPFSLALSRMMYEKDTGQAVILEKTASLRSAPDEAGTEILLLHEGTKVALSDQLSGWWKVRLANGETGWLEGKVLERI